MFVGEKVAYTYKQLFTAPYGAVVGGTKVLLFGFLETLLYPPLKASGNNIRNCLETLIFNISITRFTEDRADVKD